MEDIICLIEATTFFYYDLNAWKDRNEPPCYVELARETHVSDLVSPEVTRIRITAGYSDGFDRELQTKVKAEAGDAWVEQVDNSYEEEYTTNRWLVSGRKVYNNKGKPVKQYEPYYSGTFEYEDEEFFAEYGVTSVLHYDPLLRVVRTDMPKGFFTKVEFTPWYVATYDENDTVTDSDYYATYSTLSDDEKEALDKAEDHYNTPHVTALDTLGREFAKYEYLATQSTPLTSPPDPLSSEARGSNILATYTEYTITGKPKTIRDPRITDLTTRPVLPPGEGGTTPNYAYTYDMHDQVIRTKHIDGGDDRVFYNVMGNPVVSIDAKGTKATNTYDLLHRPLSKHVYNSTLTLDNMVEYLIYGEGQTDDTLYNLRGKLYMHYDQAGRVTISQYSFREEPKITERKVRTEYKEEAAWPTSIPSRDALLETDAYTTETENDALGRLYHQVNPDTSETKPENITFQDI